MPGPDYWPPDDSGAAGDVGDGAQAGVVVVLFTLGGGELGALGPVFDLERKDLTVLQLDHPAHQRRVLEQPVVGGTGRDDHLDLPAAHLDVHGLVTFRQTLHVAVVGRVLSHKGELHIAALHALSSPRSAPAGCPSPACARPPAWIASAAATRARERMTARSGITR